ncbi:MAG: hypothetical protein V3V05_08215 [Pontiella sp.]
MRQAGRAVAAVGIERIGTADGAARRQVVGELHRFIGRNIRSRAAGSHRARSVILVTLVAIANQTVRRVARIADIHKVHRKGVTARSKPIRLRPNG